MGAAVELYGDDLELHTHECWERGDLSYMHHDDGQRFWDLIKTQPGRVFTQRCPRRYGKSLGAVVDAIEYGITHEGHVLNYAAPTQTDAWDIVAPHFDAVVAHAPAPMRPVWRDRRLYFHTSTVLKLSGCDDRRKANRLRGRMMHRGWVDEAGSIPDLAYLIRDILMPQTLTTGGKMAVVTSPADTPAHESATIMRDAEVGGRGMHRTIYDAPHIGVEQIAEFMRECVPTLTDEEIAEHIANRTGPDDPTWQREYMAEFVIDVRRAVVPEFTRMKGLCVREVPRPSHFYTYVALDQGFHDLSFAVFGYHHFELDALVVEAEWVGSRKTSDELDAACEAIERELWTEREPPRDHPYHRNPHKFGAHEPARRVVDAPEIVIAELRKENRRPWVPAKKDDADAALNALRKLVGQGKIIVHPRCVRLRDHLEHATWNRNRSSYERPEDRERYGHFDGVDALKYLVRHVDWQRNPFPTAADLVDRETQRIRAGAEPPRNKAAVLRLIGSKKRK